MSISRYYGVGLVLTLFPGCGHLERDCCLVRIGLFSVSLKVIYCLPVADDELFPLRGEP